MKLSLILISCILITSCAGLKDMFSPKKQRANLSLDESEYLRRAEELYSQDYYEESIALLDKFLAKYSTSVLMGEVYFLRGKSYLRENILTQAGEDFEAAFRIWKNSKLGQAKSLYYLSIVQERNSQDAKLIANLLKLKSLGKLLDSRVYDFDIPAKLAAAYAREGNFEAAKSYTKKMDQYLKQRMPFTSLDKTMADQVSQSLYEVAINPLYRGKEDLDFERNMATMEGVQVYLMRTIELNQTPWAEKALYEYVQFYDSWIEKEAQYFEDLYDREDVLGARKLQEISRVRFEKILSVIQRINEHELPVGSINNDNLIKFHAVKSYLTDKVAEYLRKPDVGSGLTKEARNLLQPPKRYKLVTPTEIYSEIKPKVEIKTKDPNL